MTLGFGPVSGFITPAAAHLNSRLTTAFKRGPKRQIPQWERSKPDAEQLRSVQAGLSPADAAGAPALAGGEEPHG